MSIDFFAGCVGGCAGVLVGHPLDTIKVHLQTQDVKNPKYKGTWHCMKTIIAQDKVRGLYRGMSSPIAGIGLVNAIVFGIYGNIQRHTEHPDSLYSHFLAGSVAGFLQSVVCAPMELAKTRIQLQHDSGMSPHYKSPFDCLRHIMRTDGARGMFKGIGITAVRDVPGFASYFVSYELMMRQPSKPHASHALLAGGLAGCISWLACYPMDVIKTCLQADGMNSTPKYSGMKDCMRKGYSSDGIHFFFRGLSSTLIRAFPMNAACFYVVSWILRMEKPTEEDFVASETLGMVSVGRTPRCHVPQHEHMNDEIARKRFLMAKSLKALGAFNEAVCHTEVEELANEFYPDSNNYYLFADERLVNT